MLLEPGAPGALSLLEVVLGGGGGELGLVQFWEDEMGLVQGM
jgi:hypothetical protein